MAITRVTAQDATNASATTSVTTTYLATPTQGNLLIATLYDSDNFSGLVPPAGWQFGAGVNDNTAHSCSLWWKMAGASEPTGVTFNDAASGSMHLNIYEYTGGQGYGVDQKKTASSAAASVNSLASGTMNATTQPIELIFAAAGVAGSGTVPTWTGGFSARQSTTRLFDADQAQSVSGVNYATTFGYTGTAALTNLVIVAFYGARGSFKAQTIRPHPFSPGLAR